MKKNTSQVESNGSRNLKQSQARKQTRAREVGHMAAVDLGCGMLREVQTAAAAEGQDVGSYLAEAAAMKAFDDTKRRELFCEEGLTLRVPVCLELYKKLLRSARAAGVEVEDLARRALGNATAPKNGRARAEVAS